MNRSDWLSLISIALTIWFGVRSEKHHKPRHKKK